MSFWVNRFMEGAAERLGTTELEDVITANHIQEAVTSYSRGQQLGSTMSQVFNSSTQGQYKRCG